MIEGMRPGPVRVDPVGVAPAEVVALALRCERLEAALERIVAHGTTYHFVTSGRRATTTVSYSGAATIARAALAAAGATGKAGT